MLYFLQQGDSGGPLLCQQGSDNWVAVGAASWAPTSCSKHAKPFAYADVKPFLSWIRSKCKCL